MNDVFVEAVIFWLTGTSIIAVTLIGLIICEKNMALLWL